MKPFWGWGVKERNEIKKVKNNPEIMENGFFPT